MAYEDAVRKVLVNLDQARRILPGVTAGELSERADYLLALEPDHRLFLIKRSQGRWNDPRLCIELLNRVRQNMTSEPRRARFLLEVADQVLGSCPLRENVAAFVLDLRARSKGLAANLARLDGEYAVAECLFEEARLSLAAGSQDPEVLAEFWRLRASLHSDLCQYDEASTCASRAARLFLQLGLQHEAGLAFVTKAVAHHEGGRPQRALTEIQKALELLDFVAHPEIAPMVQGNLALFLAEAGETRRVWEVLQPYRAETYPPGREQIQAVWREGMIFRIEGRREDAVAAFGIAVQGYERLGDAHNYALASLDLALALLAMGEVAEVERRAIEAGHVLAALGVPREALAAWTLLLAATRQREDLTVFVRRLRSQLRNGRHWAAPAMLPS